MLRDSRAPSRREMLTLVAAAAAGLLMPTARAAPPRAVQLNEKDYQDVLKVQTYLNDIKTMQSRFAQVADDGGIANGTIYLERPGRMRIVYDPPVPILIVATEGQVYYYDSKLNQVSRTTVNDTPAWFLLRDQIKLGGEVTLTGFARAADAMRVTLVETQNSDIGQVTLVLSEQPLELRQWTVIDAQKKKVTVTLDEPRYGVPLDPKLFLWTDPR